MEIFKWVQELEKIYNELMEKSEKTSNKELEDFKNNEEKQTQELIARKQNFSNDTFSALNVEVNKQINEFNNQIDDLFKKIEGLYQENKEELIKIIFSKMGLLF